LDLNSVQIKFTFSYHKKEKEHQGCSNRRYGNWI